MNEICERLNIKVDDQKVDLKFQHLGDKGIIDVSRFIVGSTNLNILILCTLFFISLQLSF